MKTFIVLIIMTCQSLFFCTSLSAKIAILGYDSGGTPDQIGFVSDQFISAGTIIYFTEDEYDAANDRFLTDEGTVSYQVPAGGLPVGRVVLISENSSNSFTSDDGGTVTSVSGNWSLSGVSEEITAFAASNPTSPTTTVTMVYCWFIIEGTLGPGSNEDPSLDHTVEIIINWNNKLAAAEYSRDRSLPTSLTDILTESNWDFEITSYASSSTDFTGSFTLDAVLPVELTDFKVKRDDQQAAILEWETVTETQNKGFEIERSRDGQNWAKIGFVSGQGSIAERQTYLYKDEDLQPDHYYYRLKQIDYDGGFSYSTVKNITIRSGQHTFDFKVFPNPVESGYLTLNFSDLEGHGGEVRIVDLLGRVVKQQFFEASDLLLKVDNLQPGVYLLHAKIEHDTWLEQIVVK